MCVSVYVCVTVCVFVCVRRLVFVPWFVFIIIMMIAHRIREPMVSNPIYEGIYSTVTTATTSADRMPPSRNDEGHERSEIEKLPHNALPHNYSESDSAEIINEENKYTIMSNPSPTTPRALMSVGWTSSISTEL